MLTVLVLRFAVALPVLVVAAAAALSAVQTRGAGVLGGVLFALPGTGASPWTAAADLGVGDWLGLLYLSAFCTLFAFFVRMWAVRRTSPSRVSLLLGTEPVWAAAAGIALAGDRPGSLGPVGAVLVLVGTAWGRAVADRGQAAEAPVPVASAPAAGAPPAGCTESGEAAESARAGAPAPWSASCAAHCSARMVACSATAGACRA
ncbi:EamA family transporter [Streptomyces sp. HC307]|uniref:EamA family transporter n=1 Tax=Streptomyces flavusporus TaxID=3385496 RepID=UPI0039175798